MNFKLLRKIFFYAKPHKWLLIAITGFTIIISFTAPIRPLLIKFTLDDHILVGDFVGLKKMTLLLLVLLIGEVMIQYLETYYSIKLSQLIILDIRKNLFNKMLRLKLSYFNRHPIGTAVTRMTSDIEAIAEIFTQGLIAIIGDGLKVFVCLFYMFYLNWQLTLASLISIPLLLVATHIFKNAVKKAFKKVRTNIALLNAFVQEHIGGMAIVQVFNRQTTVYQNFQKVNNNHRSAHIQSIWAYSIFFPVVEILSSLSIAAIVWWSASQSLKYGVSYGDIVGFIMFLYMMFRPIRQLADRFNVVQMGLVAAERVFQILESTEIIEQKDEETTHNIKGKIEFRNVWFAYKEEHWVLKNFSLTIEPGESLAIVGRTGAGKSTIINLLLRFYKAQKGSICIDGVPIEEIHTNQLRKHLGFVSQDVFLFDDTIEKNIVLNQAIIEKKLTEVLQVTGVDETVNKLPGGLKFKVNEKGAYLSAGQRQLIAFARVYYKNPEVLIMDEATSSIDSESEAVIQKALVKILEKRTSIIIAHRLSTIKFCSRIIVMAEGQLTEEGTHYELLKNKGVYYNLYHSLLSMDEV